MTIDTKAAQDAPVALITGANTGIGLITATELARRGYRVVVTCRSPEKGEATLAHIQAETGAQAEFLQLDLADLGSVRQSAESFLASGSPLQLLVNNAGVAGLRGLTADGFEVTFGVNHLGHFLFTDLLLPRIRESGSARIVTVASDSHYYARGIPWQKLRKRTSLTGLPEYGVSKLANVLFSAELARRLAGTGVTTYSLHPGAVATDVWRHAPGPLRWLVKATTISPAQGARTTLHCATSPELAGESGLYYVKCALKTPSEAARDQALASELWERSVEYCS